MAGTPGTPPALLTVRVDRRLPAVWAVLGLGLVLFVGGLALGSGGARLATTGGRVFLGFGLVLGLLLLFAGVRQLLFPVPILTADERGLTFHLRGVRYVPDGFRLPWSAVRSLSLVRRQARQSGRLLSFRTVAVEVDPAAAPPAEVSYGPAPEPGVVHVDAASGHPRGEALLAALVRLHDGYR